MTHHTNSTDVVIVGGGIAGSALALVLARQGLEVTVLEQQTEYHDRVRGEVLAPGAWPKPRSSACASTIDCKTQRTRPRCASCQ